MEQTTKDHVRKAVLARAKRGTIFDFMAFCNSGEPTLNVLRAAYNIPEELENGDDAIVLITREVLKDNYRATQGAPKCL